MILKYKICSLVAFLPLCLTFSVGAQAQQCRGSELRLETHVEWVAEPPVFSANVESLTVVHSQEPPAVAFPLGDTVIHASGAGGSGPFISLDYASIWEIPVCHREVWVQAVLAVDDFLSPVEVLAVTHPNSVNTLKPQLDGLGVSLPGQGTVMSLAIHSTPPADSDQDGLLDCEEVAGGIDIDCDGILESQTDILFGDLHEVLPNPALKDIYVEVDWADCDLEEQVTGGETFGRCSLIDDRTQEPDRRSFEPPEEVFDPIEAEFLAHGYQLHFVKSGPFPATMGVPAKKAGFGGEYEVLPSADGLRSTDAWYSVFKNDDFGDPSALIFENYFGDPGDDPDVVAEKAKFMRYNIWSHTGTNLGFWGQNVDFGPVFVVGLDTSWPTAEFQETLPLGMRARGSEANPEESLHLWALLIMHELGHSLGLGHGGAGPEHLNNKPNYLSVMNYQYRYTLDGSDRNLSLPQLRYNEVDRTFDQCNLSEVSSDDRAFPLVSSEQFSVRYLCPFGNPADAAHVLVDRGGDIDWNCDGDHAGSGNFNLFDFTCVKATAVTPLPIPTGSANDDLIVMGSIFNAEDPTMPPNSIAHPDDEIFSLWISAGADRVLQTTVVPGDQVRGGRIAPGENNTCDTEAYYEPDGVTPIEGLGEVKPVGTTKACVVEARDDWDNLLVQLRDAHRTGDADSTPLPADDPGDETPFEAAWRFQQGIPVDLGLQLSATHFDSGARTLNLDYLITNHSPNDSILPAAVSLNLPVGTELSRCDGEARGCSQVSGKVVVDLPPIAAGTSVSITIRLVLECPSLGDDVALKAELSQTAVDPEPNNDAQETVVLFGADLSVASTTRPWVLSYSGEQPVVLSQEGEVIVPCGVSTFESPSFDTLELGSVGATLTADVFIPAETSSEWVGDIQLYVDVPSAGLWNQWIGHESFGELPKASWSTLSFVLPLAVREALIDDYPDARLRFATNVASCSSNVLLRDVRFGGDRSCQEARSLNEPIVSSSVLTFDAISDWSVESGIAVADVGGTQGSGAIRFDPTGWGRLTSREFLTDELQVPSDTIAYDIKIPDLPADFYWLGGANMFVDCPSAGLWNAWIGYSALQILRDGEYNRITHELPPDIATAFRGPAIPCRISLEISSNPSFGAFTLDNGGFVQ